MTDPSLQSMKSIAKHRRVTWPLVATIALLMIISAQRGLRAFNAPDADGYHAHVRQVAETIPYQTGEWLGMDIPLAQGAVTLLKPNAVISRRYNQLNHDHHATLLFVHCRDARDLQGHYPPVCYPGQGWTLISSEPRDVRLRNLSLHTTRYLFSVGPRESGEESVIDNFMILPNGTTARNMDEIILAAKDRRRNPLGAAQVQVMYSSRLTESERQVVFEEFVTLISPLLEAVAQQPKAEARP